MWPSRKGGSDHQHIVVTLKRPLKSDLERVALQCALGSDPGRAIHEVMRIKNNTEPVTAFFEEKLGSALEEEAVDATRFAPPEEIPF